jgi:hypothetical protein
VLTLVTRAVAEADYHAGPHAIIFLLHTNNSTCLGVSAYADFDEAAVKAVANQHIRSLLPAHWQGLTLALFVKKLDQGGFQVNASFLWGVYKKPNAGFSGECAVRHAPQAMQGLTAVVCCAKAAAATCSLSAQSRVTGSMAVTNYDAATANISAVGIAACRGTTSTQPSVQAASTQAVEALLKVGCGEAYPLHATLAM